MYRCFFTLLVFILIMSSCNSQTDIPKPNTEQDTTATTQQETEPAYELMEGDFGGKNFTIYTSSDIEYFVHSSDLTGEIVNDALYDTRIKTEEEYNASISSVLSTSDSGGSANIFADQVLAGDGSSNIIYGNSVYMGNIQTKGVYKNLLEVEGFQFAAPWWPDFAVEELTVADQMYLGSSTLHYAQFARSRCVYINKDLATDYGLTVPYEDVRNGTWTLDKMLTMSETVYEDTNGNGTADEEDTYGFVTDQWVNQFAYSAGFTIVDKSKDDTLLNISFDLEKMDSLVDFMYNWLYEKQTTCLTGNARVMFGNGQGLFFANSIEQASLWFRDSEIVYGFLPYPKYDEHQEDYKVFTQGMAWAMPNLDSDEAFDTAIIEALACYRYKDLIPAYYENSVSGKLANAENDVEMLELIYNNMSECFVGIYRQYVPMQLVLASTVGAGNNDFMSYYNANIEANQTSLAELESFFRENMD